MGKAVLFSAQFHQGASKKLSDVVVDRSDLLLNVCASTGLVEVQTPKGRCEKLQSVDPARRGRSNVSLLYLLQRPRVSPNSVRGALVKLSTKKNRFPHTFSKAPCSGMQLFRTSRGRVQPPLLSGRTLSGTYRNVSKYAEKRMRAFSPR